MNNPLYPPYFKGEIIGKTQLLLVNLVEGFGFMLDRIRGSHYLFVHAEVPEVLSFQPEAGQAKAYQIRQFLRLIEEHELRFED